MTGGVCAQVDPELWFPEKGGSTRAAKALCARCPVRPECLAYALTHDERFGIWGGTSERDRRRMKRTTTTPQGAPVRAPDPRTGVIRQLATTLTDPQIATRLGCCSRTVLRIRTAAGIPPAHPHRGGTTRAGAA
jgi:WhiB family redox-sensing transcriptional regulator